MSHVIDLPGNGTVKKTSVPELVPTEATIQQERAASEGLWFLIAVQKFQYQV
jgi:hypothetical protein